MECPLCGHPKAHKHGLMPNTHQRYLCPTCGQTFSEIFDILYYRRHVSPEQIRARVASTSAKEVVCAGLVELLGLPTTQLSVLSAPPARKPNWFTMLKSKRYKQRR